MPLTNDELVSILDQNTIEGVDYKDGLMRFGNQAAIYMRIVKAYIANTPKALQELSQVTEQTLEDYGIRVHGLKGSCYGISAMTCGDEAKALEIAAKNGDFATVVRDNPTLIKNIEALIVSLSELVKTVDAIQNPTDLQKPTQELPSRQLIEGLLNATRSFDVDAIRAAIDEMAKVSYSADPKLIDRVNEYLTNFRYDLIEDEATKLLQ